MSQAMQLLKTKLEEFTHVLQFIKKMIDRNDCNYLIYIDRIR
jgi:hypothetical protein